MGLPLFLIPIAVGLTAQALKTLFNPAELKIMLKSDGHMPRYGGMPSAHTAFAFSLATVVLLAEGVHSTAFAITAVVVIFILDDALRMRIFLGRHGLALKQLITKQPEANWGEFPHLEARLGHKPLEVLAGAIFGILLSWLLYFWVR